MASDVSVQEEKGVRKSPVDERGQHPAVCWPLARGVGLALEGALFKLPKLLESTNTDPFAAWFVVNTDATPDGIRVVRSVLGAISSLPIVAFRE